MSEWILLREQLPSDEVPVLITYLAKCPSDVDKKICETQRFFTIGTMMEKKDAKKHILKNEITFIEFYRRSDYDPWGINTFTNVTHWMPIPEFKE